MLHQNRTLSSVAAGLTGLWLAPPTPWRGTTPSTALSTNWRLPPSPPISRRSSARPPQASGSPSSPASRPLAQHPDLPLKHLNNPDHYLDVEELELYGLKPESLPVFRYDFVAHLAITRKASPERFPAPDASQDADHTRQLVGMLPWGLTEYYGKLKSAFSYLKAFEEDGGTPEEIANAQANIIYIMGVMGHLAGDASQPLHTTRHHHGWVGDNPNGYSTSRGIHAWIDAGYFEKTGGPDLPRLRSALRPAHRATVNGRPARPEEIFPACMAFLLEQHRQVEPLYQMEKAGAFSGVGPKGLEGRAFLENQLLKSAQFLGDLWFSAWQQAPPDKFLRASWPNAKPGRSRRKPLCPIPALSTTIRLPERGHECQPRPHCAFEGRHRSQPVGIPDPFPSPVAHTAEAFTPTP
jgi:hypothetical protein